MGDHVDDERHVNNLRKKRRFCVHKRQHCVRPMIGAPACKSCDFKKDSPISGGFVERKDNCCIMHTYTHTYTILVGTGAQKTNYTMKEKPSAVTQTGIGL